MKVLVVSCSLKEHSRSRILARQIVEDFDKLGVNFRFEDLRQADLPFCDAGNAYGHPKAIELKQAVKDASAVVLASPIYNFGCSAACKNLVELTGDAWDKKVVGFLCAAGGQSSYMSIMGLAGSLMLDFRCVVIPRFVYATGSAFSETGVTDQEVRNRIREMADEMANLARAVGPSD